MASNTTLQLKLFHDFDFGLRTSVKPRADFRRTKHDDIIKICMHDCQSPNLDSANTYFWLLVGHFAKYNSRQIFRLYGIWLKDIFPNKYVHLQLAVPLLEDDEFDDEWSGGSEQEGDPDDLPVIQLEQKHPQQGKVYNAPAVC